MADLTGALQAAAGTAASAGGAADPNFNQTVLLLHGDGTNGAQNNTFLDSGTANSGSGFTITRNGNTTQGTFSPFSLPNGEWSVKFKSASSNDRLLVASSAGLGLASANFCIEVWAYFTSAITGDAPFCTNITPSGFIADTFWFGPHSVNSGKVTVYIYNESSVGPFISESTSPPVNEWVHYAFVRDGNDFDIYRNGVSTASGTFAGAVTGASSSLYIGRAGDATNNIGAFDGYLSNLRVVNGSSVYTSGFTPPTTPLTNITNTSLRTLQSNRFVDNSPSPIAITVDAGTPSVQPFSPFLPTAAYSASVNGGSGYMSGNGSYLTVSSSANTDLDLTGTFTVDVWYYSDDTSNSTTRKIFSKGGGVESWSDSSGLQYQLFIFNTGAIYWQWRDGTNPEAITATAPPTKGWNHIAIGRDGTTTRVWVNGASIGSATNGYTLPTNRSIIKVGVTPSGIDNFNGYISNLRVVNGTDVYGVSNTSITVPASPTTAVTNTKLLLNFTNAGIIDNTGKNNLETVGNAQIDTTTKKYGTGSMEFDGTGDWLLMPNTPDQQLGTGNFTIEFWVYLASGDTGSNRGLVAKGTSTTGFLVSLNTTEKVVFTYATSTITSSGAITTNAWNHIAVVREGTGSNQTKIYIGGTNDGTGTVSTDFNQTSVMYVGANRTGGDPMKGFIDDLRITKGVARYTANFTPPTAAFPNL